MIVKIIVIGATGTIGAKVTQALAAGADGHEVVGVARSSREIRVNLDEPATVRAMFDKIRDADAVISCAGNAAFKPLAQLTDADYELGLRSKLMGQVSLARIATDQLRDGGLIKVERNWRNVFGDDWDVMSDLTKSRLRAC